VASVNCLWVVRWRVRGLAITLVELIASGPGRKAGCSASWSAQAQFWVKRRVTGRPVGTGIGSGTRREVSTGRQAGRQAGLVCRVWSKSGSGSGSGPGEVTGRPVSSLAAGWSGPVVGPGEVTGRPVGRTESGHLFFSVLPSLAASRACWMRYLRWCCVEIRRIWRPEVAARRRVRALSPPPGEHNNIIFEIFLGIIPDSIRGFSVSLP